MSNEMSDGDFEISSKRVSLQPISRTFRINQAQPPLGSFIYVSSEARAPTARNDGAGADSRSKTYTNIRDDFQDRFGFDGAYERSASVTSVAVRDERREMEFALESEGGWSALDRRRLGRLTRRVRCGMELV